MTTQQQIHVPTARLRKVAGDFTACATMIETMSKAVVANARTLPASWKGRSGKSFQKTADQCASQMNKCVGLVNGISKQMNEMAKHFEDLDKKYQGGGGGTASGSPRRPGESVQDYYGRMMWEAEQKRRGPDATDDWIKKYGEVMGASLAHPTTMSDLERTMALDFASDYAPLISNAKDATIAITGRNPVTGEEVVLIFRVLAGVTAVPAAGTAVKVGLQLAEVVGRTAVHHGQDAMNLLRQMSRDSKWSLDMHPQLAFANGIPSGGNNKFPNRPIGGGGNVSGGKLPAKPAPPKPALKPDQYEISTAASQAVKKAADELEYTKWAAAIGAPWARWFKASSIPGVVRVRNLLPATIPRVSTEHGRVIVSYPPVAALVEDARGLLSVVPASDLGGVGRVIATYFTDVENSVKLLAPKLDDEARIAAANWMKQLRELKEIADEMAKKAQGHG